MHPIEALETEIGIPTIWCPVAVHTLNLDAFLKERAAMNTRGKLPDLSVIHGFLHEDHAASLVDVGRDESMLFVE